MIGDRMTNVNSIRTRAGTRTTTTGGTDIYYALWYDYCVSWTPSALDVPALLVAVTEIDCIRLTSEVEDVVWPVDSVNGTETENWPPKLSDCVLLNHCWA